ncbi:MAG: type VI secretion system tip protein TssI/VgrG [Acidobacteriota bacterium]
MAATQQNRLLSLSTPLAYDYLLIKRLKAYEAMSQLFQYEIEALHEETDAGHTPTIVDPARVIGQPMVVLARQLDGAERHFHGICTRFVQGTRNERFTKYQIILRPRAWLLTQIRQSRIFQQKSVPDILRKVFDGLDVKFELQGKYEPRNYCVQYRESDWDFAARLMEEEGIFFFFEHGEQSHRMIIADTPQSNVKLPGKNKIPFRIDISSNQEEWQGSITAFRLENSLNTGKVTLWDHNFELPGKKLEAVQVSRFTIGGNQQLESYDFPGDFAHRFDGIAPGGGEQASELNKIFEDNKRTAGIRQQEIDVEYKDAFGTADCCALTPGYRFELEKFPVAEQNGDHVIIAARTEAIQSPSYFSDEEVENAYQCQFVCIPHGKPDAAPFRPARRTPKPVVRGSQTATVVGPAGEEIFTDKYGRVKVQFHWDREGKADAGSSCWLRVAQTWAGKKWGTMFIPRIGQEVIVDFLEGDPDKPIIIGSVYNPDNMPPYTLPDEKTKSTIKTNSSKGGGGFNEIRFEDKKGLEQIFIHAEKDADIRVKNDCREIIVHDRHLIVKNDQIEKVEKDKSLTVTGNQTEKIDGNVHLKVGTSKESKIGNKYAVDAGQEIHLKAGLTATIEAGTNLTLKVGGNFININPGGVFIKGTMVMLNSGGAAGSGSGANPNPPASAKEADDATSGSVSSPASPPPPKQPRVFEQLAQIVRGHVENPQLPSLESVLTQTSSAVESVVNQVLQGAEALVQEAEPVVAAAEAQIAAVQNAAQNLVDEATDLVRDLEQNAQAYADQAMQMAQELKEQAENAINQAVQAVQDAVQQVQQAVNDAINQAQEAVQNAIDQAQQAFNEAQQAVQQGIEQAQQAVQDAVNQAQEAVQQGIDQAQQAFNEAQQAVEQGIQQAQQAVEQVQQQAEQAVQQAQEAVQQGIQQAQQAVEQVQQQAEQAVQQAQEAVQQGIQQAQQAVEQVQQQAEQAIEQAQQAVEQVQQQAEQAIEQAQQAVGQVQQQAEQAIEQTQQTLEQAQQQAEQAMQQAQQQAEQAINEAQQAVEQGMEQAQQAAAEAQQAAEQAAQQVQETAAQLSEQAGQALQSAQNGLPFM